MPEPSAERVARNEADFRRANERIADFAPDDGERFVPFLCECAEMSCAMACMLTSSSSSSGVTSSTISSTSSFSDSAASGFSTGAVP